MAAEPAQVHENTDIESSLTALFETQRQAFLAHPHPSLASRRDALTRLLKAVAARADEYTAAVGQDFGTRHADETVVTELLTFAESARYARRNVRRWIKPERRSAGLLMAGNRCDVYHQPLGVVGIMAPWNYPLLMVLRPMVFALAAGNRIMVKPSEVTPRTAAFLETLLGDVFAKDEVAVVNGDARVAAAFSALPFDHLLFTGSTQVGRHVMSAAARNLTPVTLELGGKSPTVIGRTANLSVAAERVCFGKAVNAGQTCVAPDYVLVPRDLQESFTGQLAAAFEKMFPSALTNDHYTSVVNQHHFERLRGLLDDARARGAHIVEVGGTPSPDLHKQPLTLVSNVSDDMRIMREEIFGPLLPIVAYDDEDDIIDYINARPRPLSLNVFSGDNALPQRIVKETHSGAVSVNDALTYMAVDDLPFGGVGESGMGKYMGREGFLTFSHSKTVFRRPTLFNSARLLYAPYGGRVLAWLRALLLR